MDSSSKEKRDSLAIKKQLALYLVGSGEAYQNYKRTQQIKKIYPNDMHYYNDTFYYRHERNIAELKKLIKLIQQGIVRPQMLLYNTWNTFYPSYILMHHFQIYCQILKLFAKNQQVGAILQKAAKLQHLGFYVEKTICTDFGKTTQNYMPTLNKNGQIQMNQNYFFFDKFVSLYYHVVCFLTKNQNDNVLVFVKIRDQKGDLVKQVGIKDFGERISSEYLQVGYNLNKMKPFLAIKVDNDMKIKNIFQIRYFSEFNLSLLDLRKSLYLAIKYTQMRVQFKTLPSSRQQRPIVGYQAVGVRIINAFSKLVCFSELNRALMNNKQIIPFASPLLDITHSIILQSVIRLRECCGGFGYLQVAGHGSSIQKLVLRASQTFLAQVPQNPQILKRLHYYSSSDDMQSYFGDNLTKQNAFNPIQIFSVFINICVNMRKNSGQMRKDLYLKQFILQAAIQTLKITQQFSRIPPQQYPFLILFYECAVYIIQNGGFINWKYIDNHMSKQEYFRGIQAFQNNCLNKLIQKLPYIQQVLQVSHIRNVIIGRQNQTEFYDEVLLTSKNNLRNSQEFLDYVKRPVIQFLTQNNSQLAKL